MTDLTPEEARAEWVAALRSGDYDQTTGQLANEARTRFCCLGVACEVAIKHGVIETYTPQAMGLPHEVNNWLGLEDQGFNEGVLAEDVLVDYVTDEHTLTGLNDTAMWSFDKIADVIEEGKVKLREDATASA